MEWNCDKFEERLSDRLEGLLSPEEFAAASKHAGECADCTALAARVNAALGIMRGVSPIEPPAHLHTRIVEATLGPRLRQESGWRRWFGADGLLWQPRFAMGAVTIAASFLILLHAGRSESSSAFAALNPLNAVRQVDRQAHLSYAHTAKFVNDLRLVYEIESSLEPQTDQAGSVPSREKSTPGERQPSSQDIPRSTHPDEGGTPQARNLYAIVAPEELLFFGRSSHKECSMKCAVHTEVDAIGYCRNCGKALCAQCERDVRGALYCEDCLAAKVFGAAVPPAVPVIPGTANFVPGVVAPPSATGPHSSKPALALLLGFIPGLGAVYNGEYMKALIHVLIFGGLIAAQSSNVPGGLHALIGLATACFYFYMPIDAYRVAKARESGAASASVHDALAFSDFPGRKPTGAFILIGLGVFLLLANLGVFDWDWFGKLWPIALIALGVWVLAGRVRQGSGS